MQLHDGAKVSYVGEGDDSLAVGDRGKVLAAGETGSHVLWSTGSRTGDITLTRNFDLVATKQEMDESAFESERLVSVAVADVYGQRGPRGLLDALNEEGHCAGLEAIAEQALQLVSSRLRDDPSIKEVLASLDEDDGADFVAFTSAVLLRDAFGEGQ